MFHTCASAKPIRALYLVYDADYIACHNKAFVNQYDLLKGLKPGGSICPELPVAVEELEEKPPAAPAAQPGCQESKLLPD